VSKRFFFILIAALALIIGSGCTKRQCVEADYPTFKPILDYPADGAIISFEDEIWSFDWHHEEPCEPYRYLIRVYDSDHHIVGSTQVDGQTSELTVDLDYYFLHPTAFIYPGAEYFWNVEPRIEQEVPALASELKDDGQISQTFSFMTDGLCEPGELVPPELIEPEDGSWATAKYDPPQVYLEWAKLDNCYPEEYLIQVAIDPDFDHIVYSAAVGSMFLSKFVDVESCTHLYWRVQSVVGNSASAWSEPFSFYYEGESPCWFAQSSGDAPAIGATIKGYVFEDKCPGSLPFETESVTPPSGCVSSQIGIHADGIWDFSANTEPGIPDISMFWGEGPCPASGLDMSITDENGMYYFQVQAPGEYCVFTNKSENPELEGGIFTQPWPATKYYVAQKSITVTPGDIIEQNFGWDRDEIAKLNFKVQKLTTCRQTDNKNSQAVMYLEESSVIPVVATNEEKTWFLTAFDCFVSVATGEAEEGVLPLYPEQPIPVIDGQGDPGQTDPGQTDTADQKPCSSYTGPRSCVYPRCVWVNPIAGPGYCTESD